MRDERGSFFAALLARCAAYPQSCLTLTAIHPDGKHRTPSRHIPVNDLPALNDALERLDTANRQGWGSYFAVGLRRPGLSRWQRGSTADVVALPALFVDVDDPSLTALKRLQSASPAPSCIVHSGGGYHAYWWLDEPTTDLELARLLLRGLAAALCGDRLSVAQSLRIPSTVNTKPSRHHARCQLLELHEQRYALDDFTAYLPVAPAARRSTQRHAHRQASLYIPDPDLIARVTHALLARGYKQRGDWLNGACPFPERHKHDDQHPSFGFNIRSGYGFCHVCGTLLLRDLCPALGIPPLDLSRKEVMPVPQALISNRHLIRSINERKHLMAKKNAKAPTVITLTLPDSESDERHGTLLIARGDLAHVRQVAYTNLSDLTAIIKDGVMALSAVEAEPPVISELPSPTAAPASKKTAPPPVSAEPTVDIPLKKGKKTVKISHLKLTGGETDAAAYRQVVQLAAILIDGKLWDGETPIRIPDVYALAKKMKHLTARDMALFALDDFVQVGEATDGDEPPAATEDDASLALEEPTSPVISTNGASEAAALL